MTTKKATPAKRSVCPPVQIPGAIFHPAFGQLMTAQRLALALYRTCKDETSEKLMAWEIFCALNTACDNLGQAGGYNVEERSPE